jgi:hypothetical protein
MRLAEKCLENLLGRLCGKNGEINADLPARFRAHMNTHIISSVRSVTKISKLSKKISGELRFHS